MREEIIQMLEIKFALVRPDGEEAQAAAAPIQPFAGDAGFDLTVSRDITIAPGCFAQIPTNLSVALPKGYWAEIVGRSSAFYRRWLLVNRGVIDTGYRGEIFASVHNLGLKRTTVERGDRLFQLIVHENLSDRFRWVQVDADKMPVGARGASGFGSTGGFHEEKDKEKTAAD